MITEPQQTASAPAAIVALADHDLTELVDALVEAIDLNRWLEIDRVRSALEPFGATALFDAELRLNAIPSTVEGCICGGEVL